MADPIAWVIEPVNGNQVYLTLKSEIADKREKAGDIVTEYCSQLKKAARRAAKPKIEEPEEM